MQEWGSHLHQCEQDLTLAVLDCALFRIRKKFFLNAPTGFWCWWWIIPIHTSHCHKFQWNSRHHDHTCYRQILKELHLLKVYFPSFWGPEFAAVDIYIPAIHSNHHVVLQNKQSVILPLFFSCVFTAFQNSVWTIASSVMHPQWVIPTS